MEARGGRAGSKAGILFFFSPLFLLNIIYYCFHYHRCRLASAIFPCLVFWISGSVVACMRVWERTLVGRRWWYVRRGVGYISLLCVCVGGRLCLFAWAYINSSVRERRYLVMVVAAAFSSFV
ncbi:uncharacterized protein K452DRAFT_63546 [Aplosporella prunicola CBS 121167]|uniref:Transmembrane protein n=1 Tax=Aplosporella prunicola CBS 121167 TaxID=1176127 RepID=A0A6A6B688_9PEZI|nr:uncharacterized protein K452DRAFT_63546 [Aplosporella prunicola CBS 121167]KAF2139642.1 hypothetical protein K452DRAFT_63546 [Aplosporella prunicola CBS 121167]